MGRGAADLQSPVSNLRSRLSRPERSRRFDSSTLRALPFLLPNLLGFLLFTFVPVLACFGLSLTDYRLAPIASLHDLREQMRFVGFGNFSRLLGFGHEDGRLVANDPEFWRYLGNTLFLMLGIPISIAGSLLLALLLNQRLRGVTIFRTVYFLPTVSSAVAVCIVWKWIFHQQPNEVGLLNSVLMSLGVAHPPDWLGSMQWAKPAFIIMVLWLGVGGYNCVLYLAGLQGVPQELYEAAALDGAGSWARLRHITWPLLSPTTFFVVTMSVIAGLQGSFLFAAAFLMTGGGPAGATTTLMLYIYNYALAWHQLGYAAAIAAVLFALVFSFTLINWRYGQRLVHYQ
ncbi:MAG: carbohydrate ABC transporter permease [Armatimonadota bacterium]